MSKNWTHPVCEECYSEIEPGRTPVRIPESDTEPCCLCGMDTTDGIYYRCDPDEMFCGGDHD